MDTESKRSPLGLRQIVHDGPWRLPRLVPGDAWETEQLLHREIAFEQVQHLGFDACLLPPAGQPLLPELDGLQHQVPVTGQVVDGHVERIGERNEDTRARHRLVAFVLADRLGRHAVVNLGLQVAK